MKPIPVSHPAVSDSARDRRIARARRLLLGLLLFVVGPTIASAIYYLFIAADFYQSTSQFVIQAPDSQPISLAPSFLEGATMPTQRDTLAVNEFVRSRQMLEILDDRHGFTRFFQSPDIDWIARVASDASTEDAYDNFLSQVEADFDLDSSVATIRVKAPTAELAVLFSQTILDEAEQMVNRMTERLRHDQLAFAKGEVAEAEARLANARAAILAQQRERDYLSPTESAASVMAIIAELEAELARTEAQLSETRALMRPGAPKVVELELRVASLKQQIAAENKRLVDEHPDSLNQSIALFEEAVIEKEFAQLAYQSALTSLESARADAARQQRYLSIIVQPSQPDAATHPDATLGILTVFLGSLMAFGIGALLLVALREHTRL